MNIAKVKFPSNSILSSADKKFDYSDSYQGVYTDCHDSITSTHIGKAFFTSTPNWVLKLLELRDKVVSVFGLKTSLINANGQHWVDSFRCEPNERLGLFKVYFKSEHEVILGEDDKHLNFRISLLKNERAGSKLKKTLTISTTVKFNHWFGKLYFLLAKPFHKLIVPKILKAIIAKLEMEATSKS